MTTQKCNYNQSVMTTDIETEPKIHLTITGQDALLVANAISCMLLYNTVIIDKESADKLRQIHKSLVDHSTPLQTL